MKQTAVLKLKLQFSFPDNIIKIVLSIDRTHQNAMNAVDSWHYWNTEEKLTVYFIQGVHSKHPSPKL